MLTAPAPATSRSIEQVGEIGPLSWIPISLFGTLAATAFLAAGFRIEVHEAASHGLQMLTGIGASIILIRRTDSGMIGTMLTAVMQTIVIADAAMMLTYAAATSGRPLVDATLLGFDRTIGYDWQSYAHWFAEGGMLRSAVLSTYDSIFLQPLILIVALTFTRRVQRLEILILCTTIALLITASLFALFPATTAWVHEGIAEGALGRFKHLPLASAGWVHDLLDIRQGGMRHLSPGSGSGLTAFPSYHCIAALLNIWAAWPVKRLRAFFLLLNLCTIASTPIMGGHYVADLAAGGLVAMLSLACAARLHRLLVRYRQDRAWRRTDESLEAPQVCAYS